MPVFLIPLVSWLGTSFVALVTWFLTRKGILFAALTAIVALIGTAINLLISSVDASIGSVLPQSSFIAAIVPSNTVLCLSAVISVHLACTAYRLTIKFINWKAKVLTSS